MSAWVHNGQPSNIESVVIDGQYVGRNRTVLTLDEGSLIAEADRAPRPR